MNDNNGRHRIILQRIAHRVMLERGLLPDFSPEVLTELSGIKAPASPDGEGIRDLRDLLWCSIDNDDSMDLDQLTVAQRGLLGHTKILVAVADVTALVKPGLAIDNHARHNTTSIYTAAQIFPMLPEKLSTNLTSLNPGEDRLAIVVEIAVDGDGSADGGEIYRAVVHNKAKLAYNSVGAWLEDRGPMPEALSAVKGLAENLKLQDRTAQIMRSYRHERGALSLDTVEAKPVFEDDMLLDLVQESRNRAKDIIEDFMIGANGVTARFLEARGMPSVRRVVRTPDRWDRIVELAEGHGFRLPHEPDSKALEEFLTREKADDPVRFPDVSLSVIKLLGRGEYVAEFPGEEAPGHFGLAVKDYAHSTAPNRRYPDVITQRLLKAALEGKPSPYSETELRSLARHCTEEEDVVNKVERQVGKSAAALLLQDRIGEKFEAVVTGAAAKGTWVRVLSLPVEGMLVSGQNSVDVGDRVVVELLDVDIDRGFIDFGR